MKSKFVVLFLLVSVSYSAGQDNNDDSDSEDYSYPCSLDDLECIRDYFASTNQCTRASHEDGEPVQRDLQVSYLPKHNVTIICLEDTITFFGSLIEQFYVNKKTNNLVITILHEAINIHSPRAHFVMHQRGKEPKVAVDFVNVTYSAAITAIIPDAGLRGVDNAAVSAYNTNSMPPFEIGPSITDSSDEIVINFYQALISDIPTAVQELLLTKAPYFFYIYLQEYICNYGIEYTGEMVN